MVDTFTHGVLWPAPVAYVAYTDATAGSGIFAAFVIGAIAPDIIGELVCWAWLRLKGIHVRLRYTKETTRLWYQLERETPKVLWLYKGLHSLPIQAGIVVWMALLHPAVAVAYAFGVASHIFLDMLSHRVYSLFWPFRRGLPCWCRRVVRFIVGRKIKNWWEWPIYRKYYVEIISIAAFFDAFGLIHHIATR